ncbi:MAG: efflux RND transporter periplasmic adaptor subunit [Armatimonadetes bacterium]|nr:efflux RND transporter periplasmic adaptor subunit [Armatimonadota bacterium]
MALVVLLALLLVRRQRNAQPEVEVATARRAALTLAIAASGKVEGIASDLSFSTAGRITEIYAHEGDEARGEETLARIEPAPLGMGLGQVGQAEVIRAPYDGWVVTIYQRPGAVVQAGQAVLRLVARGGTWVTAFIDSEDAQYLKEGNAFTCRAGGYLARAWNLRVTSIGHEAIPREDIPGSARQVRVRLRTTEAEFGLPVGTPVDIDGEVPIAAEALTVPAAAVTREDNRTSVWLYADGRVSPRQVRIGANNFRDVVILEGLAAGEQVVVEGKTDLADGTAVRAVDWERDEE